MTTLKTIKEVRQTYVIDKSGTIYSNGFAGLFYPVPVKQDDEGHDIVELQSWNDQGEGLKVVLKVQDLMEKYFPTTPVEPKGTKKDLEVVLRTLDKIGSPSHVEALAKSVNMDEVKFNWCLEKLHDTTYLKVDYDNIVRITRKGEKQMDQFRVKDLEKQVQELASEEVETEMDELIEIDTTEIHKNNIRRALKDAVKILNEYFPSGWKIEQQGGRVTLVNATGEELEGDLINCKVTMIQTDLNSVNWSLDKLDEQGIKFELEGDYLNRKNNLKRTLKSIDNNVTI